MNLKHNPSSPCSCTVRFEGDTFAIQYCPVHEAAFALLCAAKGLERELSHWHGWALEGREDYAGSSGADECQGKLDTGRRAIERAEMRIQAFLAYTQKQEGVML